MQKKGEVDFVEERINLVIDISSKTDAKLILVDDLTPFKKSHHFDFISKFIFNRNSPSISRQKAKI